MISGPLENGSGKSVFPMGLDREKQNERVEQKCASKKNKSKGCFNNGGEYERKAIETETCNTYRLVFPSFRPMLLEHNRIQTHTYLKVPKEQGQTRILVVSTFTR